jgi:hypothetical protein
MASMTNTASTSCGSFNAAASGTLVVLSMASTMAWKWLGTVADIPVWKLCVPVMIGMIAGGVYLWWMCQFTTFSIVIRHYYGWSICRYGWHSLFSLSERCAGFVLPSPILVRWFSMIGSI